MAAVKERLRELIEQMDDSQAEEALRFVEVLMLPPEPPEPGDLEAIEAARWEAREGRAKPIEQVLREQLDERKD